MSIRTETLHTEPSELPNGVEPWSPIALGLWIRAGYVGVLAAGGGIAQVLNNPSNLEFAVTLLVAGTACAAFAWRRLSTVIEAVEEALPDLGRVTPTARSSSGASDRRIGAAAHATA